MSGSLPAYLAQRLALLLLTLVLVPSLSFVMFALIQGGQGGPLGVLEDLGHYLAAVFLRGDVGEGTFRSDTFIRTQGALDVVFSGIMVDVYLLGGALVFAVLSGLLAGAVQATRPGSVVSRAIDLVTAVALASPVYFLGLMVLLLFGPGTGRWAELTFLSGVADYRDPGRDVLGFLHGIWLPCVIIGAPLAAQCTRMAAVQLAGTLGEDFVRTARAKGLRPRRVISHHALRASAAPVIALVGVNMNLMLTNLALIEVVFNIPGSFRYIERALVNRDVDLVQALVVEATLFIVVANFLADALQAWIDPRVRRAEGL